MNEKERNQVVGELDQLHREVQQRLAEDACPPVTAHVEELRALLQERADKAQARESAGKLERRLLAWEAEHPQLVAIAARVARALEDSGL